jgi:hypothetical protein
MSRLPGKNCDMPRSLGYNPGMTPTTTISEADILEEVLSDTMAHLHPDAARSFLSFKFKPNTTKRIRTLLRKNNRGRISAEERITLERYLRVGQFLDLLQAKARTLMHPSGRTA